MSCLAALPCNNYQILPPLCRHPFYEWSHFCTVLSLFLPENLPFYPAEDPPHLYITSLELPETQYMPASIRGRLFESQICRLLQNTTHCKISASWFPVSLPWRIVIPVVQKSQSTNINNNIRKRGCWEREFLETFGISCPGNQVCRANLTEQRSGFTVRL